jgi:hypothetical protein
VEWQEMFYAVIFVQKFIILIALIWVKFLNSLNVSHASNKSQQETN